MLNSAMQEAINEQINKELYSAYLYLSMAAYFEANNLPGIATWMRIQSNEEVGHANKFFDYVNDCGGRINLKAIDQPTQDWKNATEVFKQVLEHEQLVTSLIHNLYKLALKENDYASQVMLQWFITEQVEEEKNATQILEQLKLIDAHGAAIYQLDHRLGKREAEEE
jgi:ferritin